MRAAFRMSLLSIAFLFVFFGTPVYSATTPSGTPTASSTPTTTTKTKKSSSGTKVTGPVTRVRLTNPIGGTEKNREGQTDIRVIVGGVVRQALTLLGSLAFIVFIIGGAYWLTSAGNSERVKKGSQTMLWAAVGMFVIFASYGILAAVIGGITGRSLPSSSSGGAGATSAPTAAVVYYKAGSADVPVLADAKDGSKPKGTITKTTDCIKSTGSIKDGYIPVSVKVPSSDQELAGWVKESSVTKSTTPNCGGPSGNAGGTGTSGITCEGVHTTYKLITNDAKNPGLKIKDGPKAKDGANIIGDIQENDIFTVCTNERSKKWGVVQYKGQVGWSYLKEQWLAPASCEEPIKKRKIDTKDNTGLWMHTAYKSKVAVLKPPAKPEMPEGSTFEE